MFGKRGAFAILAVAALGGIGLWFAFARGSAPPAGAGAPLAQVSVPALSGAALAGEAAFGRYCAACHGDNAAGRDGAGPPLVHVIYEPGHHSDAAFYLAAQRGVRSHHWPFGDMPPVDGVSGDDIADIVAYVRTLQRANRIN
ncbi:MAG: hypothetical protein Kow0026_03360 [Oricola sp.]